MQITFGDGAAASFRLFVERIPYGYTIGLVDDDDLVLDVRFRYADAVGIHYEALDEDDEPNGRLDYWTWENLARVHIY